MSGLLALLNKRDGGINGVKLDVEECETSYKTDVGVECYERVKGKGAVVVNPYSTGITNAIIPKTPEDKIPVLSMGYGLTPAADGRVFPWVFNMPTTYWSQASAFVQATSAEEGGMDKLKGKKIGLIHLDHPVRQGADPDPREALREARLRLRHLPGAAEDHAGPALDLGEDRG